MTEEVVKFGGRRFWSIKSSRGAEAIEQTLNLCMPWLPRIYDVGCDVCLIGSFTCNDASRPEHSAGTWQICRYSVKGNNCDNCCNVC